MPRRTAALVAAAMVLVTASTGQAGLDGLDRREPADQLSGADATLARIAEVGQTRLQNRLLEAGRSSVSLDRVVGGSDRPNFLVLMTDDMRDDDLQFMPNVRRLITDQGVRFTNMLSPHPLCCPARASFITGRYSHNHEVWSHKAPYGFRVFDDRQTLPRWLHRGAGYDTAFLGKYLNGYGRQFRLDGSSSLRYIPPGWTDWRAAVDHAKQDGSRHLQGGTYKYWDTTLSDNGRLEPHQGRYQTHLYSDITQDMIRRESRSPRPFFLWTSFTAPHIGSPTEPDDPEPVTRSDGKTEGFESPARPEYVKGRFDHRITRIPPYADDDVSDNPAFLRNQPPLMPEEEDALLADYRQRAESLAVVDDEIANIMATLEETGELDNTYVMFTSDNGYFLGEHRRRAGKMLAYDPSLRVPLVMRGPGIPAGGQRRDPFLMIDFAPTILAAAGVPARPDFDGQSMLDVARDGDRGWRRPVLTESGPRALDEDLLELVDLRERERGPSSIRFSQGVRTGRYLYAEHATRDKELYDMRQDPQQFVNLVDLPRYRPLVRTLAAELDRLRGCEGSECTQPLPRRLRTADPVRPFRFDPAG